MKGKENRLEIWKILMPTMCKNLYYSSSPRDIKLMKTSFLGSGTHSLHRKTNLISILIYEVTMVSCNISEEKYTMTAILCIHVRMNKVMFELEFWMVNGTLKVHF